MRGEAAEKTDTPSRGRVRSSNPHGRQADLSDTHQSQGWRRINPTDAALIEGSRG
jgi:hypothetical protein